MVLKSNLFGFISDLFTQRILPLSDICQVAQTPPPPYQTSPSALQKLCQQNIEVESVQNGVILFFV